ncbi:MAG TPA: HD domain-containing protein [Prolixibacteraceae bacterium]|jgi:hypothetical protein|nr:HD domain-containing protein [Prolixibacteraceae bacterium]
MYMRDMEESAVLLGMVRYFGDDIKRISHAFKVYGFARAILSGERLPEEKALITALTAILHDIGIKEAVRKHHSSDSRFQEMEGPAVARSIMEGCGIHPHVMDRVCFITGHHHTYSKIDGPDFQILVEADFLVNIHEGYITPEAAPSVVKKYFRTSTGKDLAASLYGWATAG